MFNLKQMWELLILTFQASVIMMVMQRMVVAMMIRMLSLMSMSDDEDHDHDNSSKVLTMADRL